MIDRDWGQALEQERLRFLDSLVLTPVDNFPVLPDQSTRWARGLYATDKLRTRDQMRDSDILFAGRQGLTELIQLTHNKLASVFGGAKSSARLLSGLHAHIVLFMGLAKPGDKVALLPVEAGGHFATEAILKRLGLQTLNLPVDLDLMCVDANGALDLITVEQPRFLFIDRSEGLKYEPFDWVRQTKPAITIFDASQYAAQIINQHLENPFQWGFDLQLLTLHKSFPGPQKAALVARSEALWPDILKAVGQYVSSSHIENTLGIKSVLDRPAAFKTYSERLGSCAVSLESALIDAGVSAFPRAQIGEQSWRATQHIWLQADTKQAAYEMWECLQSVGIQTNYRKLPYRLGWGIRAGVTAAVSRGMTPAHAPVVADLIARALRGDNEARLSADVTRFVHTLEPTAPFRTVAS